MTSTSIIIALVVSGLMPLLIYGLVVWRNLSTGLAANFGFAIAIAIAIPALMSTSLAGLQRIVSPREALDWLPLALLAVSVVDMRLYATSQRDPSSQQDPSSRRGNWIAVIGIVIALLTAYRVLWGSIYLRPTDLKAWNLIVITVWGSAMAIAWWTADRTARQRSWVEGLFVLLVSVSIMATLGMSGSFTYGIVGLLILVSTSMGWLLTAHFSPLSFFSWIFVLGLGLAFAELDQRVMILQQVSVLVTVGALRWNWSRAKWIGLVIALALSLVAVGWTARDFVNAMTTKQNSYNGYEAYK